MQFSKSFRLSELGRWVRSGRQGLGVKMNYGSSLAIFALPTRETPEPNEPI